MSGPLTLLAVVLAACLVVLVALGLNAYRRELREERRFRLSAENDRDDLWKQVSEYLRLPPARRPAELHCACCKRMRYLPPDVLLELGLSQDCKGLDL
jgi:hypothetical protein